MGGSLLDDWLARARVEAACLTKPVSIAYLTGFRSEPHERLLALVDRPDSDCLLLPGLDAEKAAAAAPGLSLRPWSDDEDPYLALATLLEGVNRLGVEKDHLTVGAAERIQAATGVRELVDVGAELTQRRLRKSAAEVEQLSRAAELTDAVAEFAFAAAQPGRSELEVAGMVEAEMRRLGAEPAFGSLIQFGANSALPHLGPTERRLEGGDIVLVDVGARSTGYCGDITRAGVAGSPDRQQTEVHQLVLAAHDRAMEAVRAGRPIREVDRAAREEIERAGLGKHFIHRVGHGLGLEAHEPPSLTGTADAVLEPGMVVTIEPGVYIPGWGGIRIEDDVLVEADGCRVLTASPRELRRVGI